MKPGKPWSHTTELPVLAASAFKARDFVGRHLIEHGLSYLTDDVQLVVSELATNALIHAQTPFTVTLQALGRSVATDGERRLDGRTVVRCGARPRRRRPGIRIAQALSRDWGVSVDAEGGKSVWAVFDTRQAHAATDAATFSYWSCSNLTATCGAGCHP